MSIRDLAPHPAQFVTIAELAEYWAVSPKQIRKRIESGALPAMRFGSRPYRIGVQSARSFEQRNLVKGAAWPPDAPVVSDARPTKRLPRKFGPKRVDHDLKGRGSGT